MRYSIIGATVQQVQAVGGTNIKEAPYTGIIFAILDDNQVAKLLSQGCSVKPIKQVKAAQIAPPTPMVAEAIYTPDDIISFLGVEDLRYISDPPILGSGYTIAVIDTGIRETHELIAGRVVYSRNFTDDLMEDTYNHGTGVASLILAVIPMCNIINFKVLGSDGIGTEEDVVLAISQAIFLQDSNPGIAPQVINLSLGQPDSGDLDDPVRIACRAAINRGIWVVAANGNNGDVPGAVDCPACEEHVIAVGSCSPDPFVISYFSSTGPTLEGLIKPDMVIFGENLLTASSEDDISLIAKSGASFATPFVSGLIVVYNEAMHVCGVYLDPSSSLTPEELLDTWLPVVSVKPQYALADKDNTYGYGVPDGALMLTALGVSIPSATPEIIEAVIPIFGLGMAATMITNIMREQK